MTKRIVFPREVLLVEVERRCGEPVCGARTRLSLTKAEARSFTGFECERCGRWYADALSERDIPEWWEELNVASLRGLKPERKSPKHESAGGRAGAARVPTPKEVPTPKGVPEPAPAPKRAVEDDEDDSEVVVRMSDAWRRLGGEREAAPEIAEGEEGRGDSS